MAETIQSLDQLGTIKPAAPDAPKYVQKLDKQGRAYATGKRKNAVARVWIKPGTGKVTVNERTIEVFFARPVLRMMIQQPLVAANRDGQYDVVCTVSGGGLSGQAGAVRHGISKALTYFEPELRGVLKKGGFLTRDTRVVERKKYGREGPPQLPVLEALSFVGRLQKGALRRAFFVAAIPPAGFAWNGTGAIAVRQWRAGRSQSVPCRRYAAAPASHAARGRQAGSPSPASGR